MALRQPESMQPSWFIADLMIAFENIRVGWSKFGSHEKIHGPRAADWCKEIMKPNFVFRAKDHGV